MKFIVVRFCLALLLGLGYTTVSQALQPPTAEQIERYKKDGSWEERVRNAYAIGNHRMAPGLAAKANYKLRRLAYQSEGQTSKELLQAPPLSRQGMPSTGNVKMFVLLIEFSEYPHITGDDQATVDSRIFGSENTGSANYPYESLHAYYDRSSYSLLNLQGATLGWFNVGKRSDVAETVAGRETLIKNAINHFHDNGHDFSQYDNNGDGDIDYFAVIWTGPHGEWASFWWGYQTRFSDSSYTVDGKNLDSYSWQWESQSYPSGSFNPLVLIHETGHAIGLPDYYDYDDSRDDGVRSGPNGGVGGLDMMDSNKGDHNAFSKFVLDWLNPTVISTTGTYPGQVLASSATTANALLIMPNASGSSFEEFFMVHHRKRERNDTRISADGLLIWHVDARLNAEGTDYRYDNSSTIHKLLRLMEADGLEEIEQGTTQADRQADEGDFYTTGDKFTPSTTPNSNAYNATTGIYITSIASADNNMTCNVAISGKYLSFQRLTAGGNSTAFIQSDGSFWVWGWGYYHGSPQETYPVRIGVDNDYQAITAGWWHMLALKQDSSLWGFGDNSSGEIGDGTTENHRDNPIKIGTATWQAIAAGKNDYSIALQSDGSLWAWGNNSVGQLGDGTTENKHSPIRIGTDNDWQTVSAGGWHSVALKQDGSLYAWGDNSYGQLGDGTTENKHSPIRIGTDNDWQTVSAGHEYTVALKNNGSLWAWGRNIRGQIGDGTTEERHVPVQVGSDSDWQVLDAGKYHVAAIKKNGTIYVWGDNSCGQLGDGTTETRYRPVKIGGDSDWKIVVCGQIHTVALKNTGSLWTWGSNGNGQLGDGTTIEKHSPIQVIFPSSNNDTDNDGIDDAWEMEYFGNLTTANSTSDYDKDGYSDKQEYLNWLAGEQDPEGGIYDPTEKNVPGGTDYVAPSSISFPAIYKLLLKH